jgi:hypothetical protein
MGLPVHRLPVFHAGPYPLDPDIAQRAMLVDHHPLLEVLRGFMSQRLLAYGCSAVIHDIFPTALNLKNFRSHFSSSSCKLFLLFSQCSPLPADMVFSLRF